MDARFGVAIPVSIANTIHDRIMGLRQEIQKKLDATERKIRAGKLDAMAERKDLIAQLNKLTTANVLRYTVILGAGELAKVKDEDLHVKVVSNGLSKGRRKHAA